MVLAQLANLFSSFPVRLDYLSWPQLAGAFALMAVPTILLFRGRMSGMGPVRKWVALATRLAVVLLLLLILAGPRIERKPTDLEVLFVRDASQSADNAAPADGARTVADSLDRFITDTSRKPEKPPTDRVGVISFRSQAALDVAPQPGVLARSSSAIRDLGDGTNLTAALELALASMSRETMHRFVLAWDGNVTAGGDLDTTLNRLNAAGVRVDVLPLRYDLTNEVIVDRLTAPAWRRENEPFSLDIAIRSTNPSPVTGQVRVTANDVPLDMDERTAGVQSARTVTLQPGPNIVRVSVPPSEAGGVHRFRAVFEPADALAGQAVPDTVIGNNVAEAITFVRGQSRVLLVDNTPAGELDPFVAALSREGIGIAERDRITPDRVPDDATRLHDFDAIILANVPRGAGGLSEPQQKAIAGYVRDLGGGLIVTGGPDALGAGGWQGSMLEQVLPLDMDVPARRVIPRGALALVIDRSGSMGSPIDGGTNKQQAVIDAAILAVKALSPQDVVGVVGFDSAFEWIVPLGPNIDPGGTANKLKQVGPDGGTNIYPALAEAVVALTYMPEAETSARHILLLTDGQSSDGDYDTLVNEMAANGITLSTVGVGADHDKQLLQRLAQMGKGKYYPVDHARQLPQIFIREARTVRRTLITENRTKGFTINQSPDMGGMADLTTGVSFDAPVYGMVLTSRKQKPGVEVPLVAGPDNDPLLAYWQVGAGRSVVFTSDAIARWSRDYVGRADFGKFWAQVLRSAARTSMSGDFDLRTEVVDGRGRITVEALSRDNAFVNFASIGGSVLSPDGSTVPVRLAQTAPGVYTADFPATAAGAYAVALNVSGRNITGSLRGGLIINDAAELRPLRSNDSALQRVADRTGGQVLGSWDAKNADLFRRNDLVQNATLLPVWDMLLLVLLGLFIFDVAIRRLAFTWSDARRLATATANRVRGFTVTTRQVESGGVLDALRKTREETTETISERMAKQDEKPASNKPMMIDTQATGPRLRGASDRSAEQTKPASQKPATDGLGSLLDAKRRAREQMDRDEGK